MLDKRNFYINGEWVKPFKQNDFEVINPSSEKVCATISLGTEEDVNKTLDILGNVVDRLRELSPLWEMHLDGIDLDTVEWNMH